jgi:hypothetical protein
MWLPRVNDKLNPNAYEQRPPEYVNIRGVMPVRLSDINGNTAHLPYTPPAPDGSAPGSGGTALSRANRNNTGLFAPKLPRSAPSAVPSNAMSRHNKTVAKNQPQPVLNVPQVLNVLRVLDCNRDDKVPRKDFKRKISWEIEGGLVENLQLRVTRISSVDGGEKVDLYPIANEAANAVPLVPIEIDHWQAISLLLVGDGCAPSISLEIPIDDSVPLRAGGGPLRNLLNHHHVAKNAKETTKQKVEDGLAALDRATLRSKACELLNAAADYFSLDDKLLKGTGFEKSQLRGRSEVVSEVVLDVIKDVPLSKAFVKEVSSYLPVIGVVKASGKAAKSLVEAGLAAHQVRKMVRIEEDVSNVYKYSERPKTPMAVLGRIEEYQRRAAKDHLLKFATSFLEAACRLTVGLGTVVAAALTIQSFVRYLIERYIDDRLVEITNLKLKICQKTGNPEAYYDVIENGHICVATHIVVNYRNQLLTGPNLDIPPLLDKVVARLRKGDPELIKIAKTISGDQRYRVAPLTGDYTGSGSDSSPAAVGH